jgi:hypothetical protein
MKVKLFLGLFKYHAMKTYPVLTRHHAIESSWYPLDRRLGEEQ